MNLTNDNGVIRLYDAQVVYVEQTEYSETINGPWIETFDSSVHKYRRVKHAGDTVWQEAAKWVPEDGQDSMLRVEGDILQTKLELDTEWTDLYDLSTLEGAQGIQGEMGTGWNIDSIGALDLRVDCCGTPTTQSSCNTCNTNAVTTSSSVSTFMSLGNHRLTGDDIGTYYQVAFNEDWVIVTEDLIGTMAYSWGSSDNIGTGAVSLNAAGETLLVTAIVPIDSTGIIYVCAEGIWTKVFNMESPTGLVRVTEEDVLGYLKTKLDDITIESYVSGTGLLDDRIRVKENGIDKEHITSDALSDGLTGGSGDYIKVVGSEGIVVDASGVSVNPDTTKGLEILDPSGANTIAANINVAKLEFVDGEISVKDSYVTGLIPGAGTLYDLTLENTLEFTTGDGVGVLNTGDVKIGVDLSNVDHGLLQGLEDNDHPQYLLKGTPVKGDILVGDGTGEYDPLTVGDDDEILVADSTTPLGIKWVANTPSSLTPATTVTDVDGTVASTVGSSTTEFAREDHIHGIVDASIGCDKLTTELKTNMNSKVQKNVIYGGNIMIDEENGLLIQSYNKTWYKVKISDNGDFFGDRLDPSSVDTESNCTI